MTDTTEDIKPLDLLDMLEGQGKYIIEVYRYINKELGINEQRVNIKTIDPAYKEFLNG